MPEVKDKTVATDSEAAQTAAGGGSSGMLGKVAMIGGISLIAVVAAYFLTVQVLKPMMAPGSTAPAGENAQVTEEEAAPPAEEHGDGHGGHGGDSEGAHKGSTFHTIESIVVNPAGTAGTRFLSCSVNFEVDSKASLKAFEALDVQIRDVLITILSSKTVDELADIAERNRMRREILSVVNKVTAPATAKAVYLTDFVLQ